jgi:YD repeat-containing protein
MKATPHRLYDLRNNMFTYKILSLMVIAVFAVTGRAQTYLNATGSPTFVTPVKVENGFVNTANGNLHLEIPLGTFPQRGRIRLTAKMVYDSRIWQVVTNGSSSWQPTNVANSQGGWRFVTTIDPGAVTETVSSTSCGSGQLTTWQVFIWTDPAGTQHAFPISTSQNQCTGVNTATGDAYAADSTGFHMYVTNFNSATVFAKDGTQVYPSMKDTNGNFFTTDANGNAVDMLNRTPVVKTVNGATTTYDVLNSLGSTSRFTVTTTTVNVNTAFGQSGVAEYAGSFTAVQSIALPDGSSYSFTYDSGTTAGFYGELASMTLRTGGQVQYGYTSFADAYGNTNRWLTSRRSSGTWSYTPQVLTTCAPGATGCQQQVIVARPSGDQTVFTFTLNNGAWNTQTQFYSGAASGGTLLRTIARDFDFSNACPFSGCTGNAYIELIRRTTTEPIPAGNISKKTEYTYDNISYGNFATVKDWYYYSGTPSAAPDRELDIVYLTSPSYVAKDIHNRVTSRTVLNGAGAQVAQSLISYDGSALTSITGVTHHDDANYGTAATVRGNPTQLQRWVSGSSYLTTTMTYDMTGQMLKVTNPRGHTRSYVYANNFYTDANPPVNPPATFTPTVTTNAYITQVIFNESAGSGSLHYGYYFNTGKLARDQDANLSDIFHHYTDPLDRETYRYDHKLSNGTRGWVLTVFTSSTQTDIYKGITDTTPSVSCVSCRHDVQTADAFGRGTNTTLANDPSGATKVDAGFDDNDRIESESNPYRSTSDPTYGVDTLAYDGLDRVTSQAHADSNALHTYYGAAVSGAGGAASQLCSATTYGVGYPILAVDEAGKKLQRWINAFGGVIEVDEPDSTNALTVNTCYAYDALQNNTQIVQGSETRSYAYDGISRQTSATEPESGTTQMFYTTSAGAICSGADDICRKTDARGITTTYTYDIGSERDRLSTISYSDGTPTTSYFYDQSTYNGLTITFPGNRRTGMSDGSGQTAWSYDPAGHIVTERRTIGTVTENTSYTYNVDGSTASITYPSGRVINYTYNNAQQTVSVVDATSSTNYITDATYAPHGRLATAVHGKVSGGFAGVTENYTYNNRLQMVTHSASSSNGSVLDETYHYDLGGGVNNGNITSITNNLDTTRTQLFTYDNLNRLASAQSQATSGANCWGDSYGYDRYDNLLNMNVTQCSAPNLNVTVNNNNQIVGFTYDAAGNLTNDGTLSYSWDGENRLKNTAATNYTWDGTNMRVMKGTSELYWFSAANCKHPLFGRSTAAGSYTAEFIYFNGRQVGYRDDTAGQAYHYINDHRGSAKVMTNSTGIKKFESDYYPHGGQRPIITTEDSLLKFQGRQRDTESGLDNVRRTYSPATARVLTPAALTTKKKARVLAPKLLNAVSVVKGKPLSGFAAFDESGGCAKCLQDCAEGWAVCMLLVGGPEDLPGITACAIAWAFCNSRCQSKFGKDCLPNPFSGPKKPKPPKPSPGTPAPTPAPPGFPPVPGPGDFPSPAPPPDDNGDTGPGSGWCPDCPPPQLIPRGPGPDDAGGDDGGGDNPGPFTDAGGPDDLEP